jgi:hypothetical protein
MERKIGRWYQLQIETDDAVIETAPDGSKRIVSTSINHVTITHPTTVEFEVTRNNLASANSASFKIYNLSAETRNRIFRDPFAMEDLRAIQFTAGYKDGTDVLLGMIFNGQMRSAISYRQGTEWITEIEAFDGAFGMANSTISMTVGKGADKIDVIKTLVEAMPGVKGPVSGNIKETIKRGVTLMGNAGTIIKEMAAGNFSIDNGVAYVLNDNEVIEGDVKIIKSESGLIGVPRRSKNFLEFDMMFEPRLKINQMIKLTSDLTAAIGAKRVLAPSFNGEYKVIGLTHRGTISGAVCEDAITTVTVLFDASLITVPQ